jgi:hypothetical protein
VTVVTMATLVTVGQSSECDSGWQWLCDSGDCDVPWRGGSGDDGENGTEVAFL